MANVSGTQAVFSAMLESKRAAKNAQSKRKVESKTPIAKKAPVGAKTPVAGGRLIKESTIPARRKVEGEDNDVMDDVIDNIQVVTDPNKNADELESRADDIQDAIENSPEGEEAFSDEYVGDNVYACPICGESFFADETYHEGDACPICQAEPADGFLNQGVVAASEPDDFVTDDEGEIPTEGDFDDFGDADDVVADVEEDEEDEEKMEGVNRARNIRKRKTEGATLDVDVNIGAPVADTEEKYLPYDLDDESFNGALDEFVTENYGSSVKGMKMVKASYNEAADAIKIECRLTMKNGKKVPATFVMKEAKNYGNRSLMTMTESTNTFKVEATKTPAFKLSVIRAGKMLACESISYGYVTTHPKAGKVKVEGIAHGFKSASAAGRIKNESRAAARKPVSEKRRITRK